MAEPQVKISLSQLPTLRCTNCRNFTFNQSIVLKKVSALISPDGKEQAYPVPVFTCTVCGALLPVGDGNLDFIADIRDEETNTEQEPKSIIQP